MQVAYDTLRILSDGKFHSGTTIALHLGVSRSTVWKGIDFLRKLEVAIQAVSGRGFRWELPSELLNREHIVNTLSPSTKNALSNAKIDVVNVIPSTNDYLLQRIAHGIPSGTVCTAEAQTAGKGRMGKQWRSPYGANIYLSLYWRFGHKIHDLSGLSLVAGLAVIEALKEIAPLPLGIGIKWPNDIWYQDLKLGGILIESMSVASSAKVSHTDVVMGIGLNVNHPVTPQANVWTDLHSVFGFIPSRNGVIAHILNKLVVMLEHFEQFGFAAFMALWTQYDLLVGKSVQLYSAQEQGQGNQIGIAQGVNERGELCIKIDNGLKAIRYGDVSIRPTHSVL